MPPAFAMKSSKAALLTVLRLIPQSFMNGQQPARPNLFLNMQFGGVCLDSLMDPIQFLRHPQELSDRDELRWVQRMSGGGAIAKCSDGPQDRHRIGVLAEAEQRTDGVKDLARVCTLSEGSATVFSMLARATSWVRFGTLTRDARRIAVTRPSWVWVKAGEM